MSEVGVTDGRGAGEQPVLPGRLAQDCDAEASDELEAFVWLEVSVVDHRLCPDGPRPEQAVTNRLRRAGGGRAPDAVLRPGVEPPLRVRAHGLGVRVRVHHRLQLAIRGRREEQNGEVGRGRVVGWLGPGEVPELVRDVLDDDLRLDAHGGERGDVGAVGDGQPGAAVRGPELQIRCRDRLRARCGDETRLERPEHDGGPGRRPADQYEHRVVGLEASFAEKGCPSGRVARDVGVRPMLDDPVAADEGKCVAVRAGGKRLDDVPDEVEQLRLPVRPRRRRYPSEAEPSHLSRYSSRTGLKTSITVAPSGPQ